MKKSTRAEKNLRIAILGYGREGRSLHRFLKKKPAYKNAIIEIRDRAQDKNYLRELASFDILFRSPGVPYTLPELRRAKRAGVTLSSPTTLFFEEIKRLPRAKRPLLIGVTGSKGKGTTASLIYHILKTAKKRALIAGNIGRPMLDILPQAKRAQYVILELSSFQLQGLDRSPDVAVVLDIFPEHLDVHKNLAEYTGAKANIGKFQRRTDAMLYFSNNHGSKRIAARSPAKKIGVMPTRNGVKKNFDMAEAVAHRLGINRKTIAKAVASFRGLKYRMEIVQTTRGGVRFINDSAATNPEATAAAVASLTEPTVLIAGGKDKGLRYAPLARALKRSLHIHAVFLYGENRKKIAAVIRGGGYTLQMQRTLLEAFREAYHTAKLLNAKTQKRTTVLFSPAAASFDQFKNYAERGKYFTALTRALK